VTTPVAIIGGGLAGVAAAVRLAEAGFRPIVIETRRKLGGRATSFIDPRTGEVLDNCQHVLLGCCTNLIDLYDRLGVLEQIQWHRELYWTAGSGQIDRMRAGWLPAPAHLTGSFLRMRLFSFAEKRQIAAAMWKMIRLGEKGRWTWRDQTFAAFLASSGQSDSVVRRFWNVIIISACNLAVDRVSAAYAMQVFQQGFLANRWSYVMGSSRVPLWELYDPATTILEQAGGEIRLGTSAKAIAYDGRRVTGVVTDDGTVESAAVISAAPWDRLDKLVTDTMRRADARLQHLDRLTVSPILGVHLRFGQPIMQLPHLVVVDGDVQWLFNKGVDAGGRQHIHAVISGADEWMSLPEEEIIRRVVADVHRALPASVGLEPIEARAVKEKRATFAAVPGVDAFRPTAAYGTIGLGGGGIENLYLAGDWCDTGWPATMEGAVRSGYAAAAAISGGPRVVPDIPPSLFARALGLR
jgi:zeta-carotene desaturase